eukprot:6104517-Ditylum_brightwellii.AAC.1
MRELTREPWGKDAGEDVQRRCNVEAREEKKQEREMRIETGKLFESIQQCESFSVANLNRKILIKLKATTKQNEMAEDK